MVTATLSRPKSLVSLLIQEVVPRVKLGLQKAAELVPSFIQDNFIDEGTRGKGGQNRWARVSPRQIIWRKTYPHGGSPEQKHSYWFAHKPLRDTDTLYNSFKPGKIFKTKDGFAVKITSSTNYGWRHHFGGGTTPDGQPIWRRPHIYIVDPTDTTKMFARFREGMAA